MKNKLCIVTTMSLDNSISDEMRSLIIAYMKAVNEDDYVKSEGLLHKIQQENRKNGSDDRTGT
jgi:hypothetical protein